MYKIHRPMHEVIGQWSHREYKLRAAWMRKQINEPSRTDHYLMQIAAEVRRVLSKAPNKIKVSDFLLKFEQVINEITEENAEARTRASMNLLAPLMQMATINKKN